MLFRMGGTAIANWPNTMATRSTEAVVPIPNPRILIFPIR